jgi:hypothetical protein
MRHFKLFESFSSPRQSRPVQLRTAAGVFFWWENFLHRIGEYPQASPLIVQGHDNRMAFINRILALIADDDRVTPR